MLTADYVTSVISNHKQDTGDSFRYSSLNLLLFTAECFVMLRIEFCLQLTDESINCVRVIVKGLPELCQEQWMTLICAVEVFVDYYLAHIHYLFGGQLASFGALTLLVGSSDL